MNRDFFRQLCLAALGAGVSLLAVSFMSRRVDSAIFGLFLSSAAVIGCAGVIIDLGSTVMGLQRTTSDPSSAFGMLHSIQRLRLYVGLVVIIPMFGILTMLYGGTDIKVRLLILCTAVIPIFSADFLLLARQQAGTLQLARMCGPIVLIGFLIPHGPTLERLIFARFLSTLMTTVLVRYMVIRAYSKERSSSTVGPGVRALLRNTLPLFVSSGFTQLYTSRLDQVILGRTRSSRDVGSYGAVYTLYSGAVMPLQSFLTWNLPALIRAASFDDSRADRPCSASKGVGEHQTFDHFFDIAVKKFRLQVMILSSALALVFAGGAPLAQHILFPSYNFQISVTFLLAGSLPMVGAGTCFGYPLLAKQRNRTLTPVAPLSATANIAANLLLTPAFGPVGSAAAMLIGESVMFFTSMRQYLSSDLSLRSQKKSVAFR